LRALVLSKKYFDSDQGVEAAAVRLPAYAREWKAPIEVREETKLKYIA